jgi:uncharacterized protein (TIGR02145 family)/uncharacterized repeat protein (TIGR02543 family)
LSSLDAREKKHFGQKSDAQSRNIRLSAWLLCLLLLGTGIKVTTAAPDRHGALPAGHTTLRTVTATHNLLTGDSSRVDLTVKGEIPAQVRVSATPVQRTDVDGSPMLAAYDITLTGSDGQEWQPAYGHPVTVTISDPSFGNGRNLDIFHENPDGREYVTTVVSVNNTVTFAAKHFSVYVVGTANNDRLVVMFLKAYNPYNDPNSAYYETPLASGHQNYSVLDTVCMLVKRADTVNNGDNLKTLIYASGPGYMYPGVQFFGWAGTPDYTTDPDEQMTIHDVRDSVYQRLLAENSYNDLDTVKFFPVLLRNHKVYYRTPRHPKVAVAVDDILYRSDSSDIRPYVVNQSYVPEVKNENFNGWKLVNGDANVTYGNKGTDVLYYNGDSLNIQGDLTFMADISYGYWMTFDENGKGATYTAPIFLESPGVEGQVGDKLIDHQPEDPTRFGYTFSGWYADATTTVPFVFKDGYLDQDTSVYAKWIPNARANYTVMVWRQNLARDGYDLVLSYSDSGNVGQLLTQAANISTGTEGDLTFVNVLGHKLGGIKYVPYYALTDPFTGFTLSTANPIHDTVVTPEGESVLNIYFDRMRYTLRLYVTRIGLNGSPQGPKTGNNKDTTGLAPFNPEGSDYFGKDWVTLQYITRIKEQNSTSYVILDTVVSGGYRYLYHTITAYYGENISDRWISYDNIESSYPFVSWILMPRAKAWVSGTNGGNTLKGDVSILDEQLLGNLADTLGNLITARYETDSYEHYYFLLYLADAQGNYPSVPNDSIYARSAGDVNKNVPRNPSVEGYIYDYTVGYTGTGTGYTGTGTENNPYIIRKCYRPATYDIFFMDGNYVNGNGNSLQNRKSHVLKKKQGIPYGKTITNYNDTLPGLEDPEFLFEGWYADEACTQPYTFTTMPLGGVRVYAKWRQIQYRVFLHPQAGRDQSLNWGSENQAMNFRISYGDKVSPPMFGQRDLYAFGGWYTDPECSVYFDPKANPLNEHRVTADYDKGDDLTDAMDKWGDLQNTVDDPKNPNGPNGAPYNSDAVGFNGGDRFWITKKLDLYAQWKYKFDGAEGAMVEYVCDACVPSSLPVDTNLYLDKSKVVSMPGATPSSPDSIFTHWIIQRWSSDDGKYVDSIAAYPGGPFILDLTAARRQQITADSATYTFRLRANLEPVTAKKTFIVWYRNIEESALNDTVRYDAPDTMFYHKGVSIPYPGDREGYVFKGWHRKAYLSETAKEDVNPYIRIGNDTTNVNFLWYKDGSFYTDSIFDSDHLALEVAVDPQQPYHFMYAVWKPIVYTVRFNPNTDELSEDGCDKMDLQDFTYDEEKNLLPNCFVWPCHKFLGWTRTSNNTGDTLADQQLVKNLSLTDKDTVDLYAVWETTTPTLTLDPDSATCINPGSLTITVNNEMPSYHYMVYGLDTTQTPAVETAQPVWEVTLDDEVVTVPNLDPGRYRVKVSTATGCELVKDTTIFVKPEEITFKDNSMTFCGHSTFSIVPSNNPNVTYLWSAPIIQYPEGAPTEGVTVTPGENSTTPASNISGTLVNNSEYTVTVTYEVYPILDNCPPGLIELPINVGVSSPNYEISLSAPTESVCAGSEVAVTATVNDAISSEAYTLHWVVDGDTTHRTLSAEKDTVMTIVTIPADLCRGNYTVEAYYENGDNLCQVSASTPINVVMKEWIMPADGGEPIGCVLDTLPPHLLNPSPMPEVTDGCDNTLTPEFIGRTKSLDLHNCSGTVTYTYQYTDCTGETKYWSYVYTIQQEAPVLTINETPTSEPIGNCAHRIPTIYNIVGCGNLTVTQTPPAGTEYSQTDEPQSIKVTVTATDECGHTVTRETWVTIPAKPTITVEANPSAVCPGTPVTLHAVVTGTEETPVWVASPSGGSFSYTTDDTTFSSNTPGSYTLTASVGNMAENCRASASKVVKVNPPVTLTAGDTTQTVCRGDRIKAIHITYTAANVEITGLPTGVGFNNVPGDPHIAGSPLEAGVFHYTITATSTQNPPCDPITLTGTITVIEDVGEITISCDSLCEEKTTTLVVTSTIGSSYVWQKDGADLPGATSRTLPVSEAGTYTVTAISPGGHCTSVGSITLTQHETKRDTLRETICENLLPYAWGPVKFEAAGLHSDTLATVLGCDSIVTRVLTVNHSSEPTSQTVTECDSYVWVRPTGDTTITTSGTYVGTFQNVSGCDSVVTLNVTINRSSENEPQTVTECDSYVWVRPTGDTTITTSGTYVGTFTNVSGCDSVVTLNVTINRSSENEPQTVTECDSYVWVRPTGDTTITTSGTYVGTFTNVSGCDSVVTLHLTINHSSENEPQTVTVCDSYVWHRPTVDTTITTSGTYVGSFQNVSGCDSVVTLNVTINHSATGDTTAVSCDSFTWHGVEYTETPATAPTFTYETVNGCDSVVTLHLTINPLPETPVLSATNNTSCLEPNGIIAVVSPTGSDYTYSLNGGEFQSGATFIGLGTGSYTVTVKDAHGCESSATEPISTIESTLSVSASADSPCLGGTIQLSATTETAGVTFAWTGPNDFSSTDQNPTIGNAAETMNGTYTVVVTETATGCTATATAMVKVKLPVTYQFSKTACDSYTWNGQTYTTSNDYTQTFTAANGCDSVVTLHLTINPLLTFSDETTICANLLPYTFHGHVFTEAGTLSETVPSVVTGCDSTWTLTVNVNPMPTLSVTNKTQTGLIYGDNIATIEITNTNSNLTVTPAGTYSHIQYESDTKTISSSNYLSVGTYKFYVQAASDKTPQCGTLKDTVTVTVSPKPLTLVSGSANKMYDGSAVTNEDVTGKNANGLLSETGWVGNDGATYTFTGTQTEVGSSPNAFSYTAKTGTDLNNYTIIKTEGTLTVGCKTVTITVANASKTYGDDDPTFTGTVEGLVNATDLGTITYVRTNATENNVGEYDNVLVPSYTPNANYCVDTVKGKFTITPRPVTITANSHTFVYDGAPHSDAGYSVDGLIGSDALTATVVGTIQYVSESPVTNKVTSHTFTTGNPANYNVSYINGQLTMIYGTCTNLTIKADSQTWTYDGISHGVHGYTLTYGGSDYHIGADGFHTFANGDVLLVDVAGSVTHVAEGNVANVPTVVSIKNGTEDVSSAYCVNLVNGTLAVTCRDVVLTSGTASKTYDGTPLTNEAVGVSGSGWLTGKEASYSNFASITYAGSTQNTFDYTLATGEAAADYCVTVNNGTLTVKKKALIIELDSTKMYDGTKFTVTYDQLYPTGLVNGDVLASGNMWTESYPSVVTNYSGIHVGQYENHDGFFSDPLPVVGYVDKSGFSVKDASGTDVTGSYVPAFKVILRITLRPITITAATDSKVYDGTVLTNNGHSITSSITLADGDSYTADVNGEQLCKGWSYNTPSGAVVTRGTENVNHDYQISYEKGTLTVTDVDPGQFVCPTAETFLLNDCETSTSITLAGTPTVTGVAADKYTVDNDLADLNPLTEGTHTIHWTLLDDCGYEIGSCEQEVTVEYKQCAGVTWQGYPYEAVRIGSQCWLTENLRWNTGSAVAYNEDNANVAKFGYLYSWYTAVGVPEGDDTAVPETQLDNCGNPYVQGICPPGWGIGSQADHDLLNITAGSTSVLKDPSNLYWLPGYQGVEDGTGFDARGGGWYNSTLSRFEDLMTNYYFWKSDSSSGSTITSSTISYYCDDIITHQSLKTDKKSVRCVRKVNE